MNQYFFDHLTSAVILEEDGKITRFNQPAQDLFPQLGQDASDGHWLKQTFPLAQGTLEQQDKTYTYRVVPQENAILYLIDPTADTRLREEQITSLLYHMREHLSSVIAIMDNYDMDDQVYAPLNRKVTSLLRLANNCDLAMGEELRDQVEVFDLAGMLRELCGEIPTVLPQADITQNIPLSVLVETNMKYLRKAILGLCANSFSLGNRLAIKVTTGKTQALLELRDENTLKQDISTLMTGRSNSRFPSPKGAGFGLLAVQQTLRSFHCNLWAEESPQGGLVLTISIPLHKKSSKNLNSPMDEMVLDKDGGWNDLLLELCPVLKEDLYTKESVDKYNEK